jgi:IPT/TIG domain
VTITGTGFTGATGVSFGQTAASNFNVVNDTQITAISPAGSGIVDVIVTTPGGTSATNSSDQFTYTTPPPTITAIKPNSGPNTGGSNVTIVGTGFIGATNASFGQATASSVSVISDTLATVVSPPGSGTVDITITTPAGTSKASSVDQFTYTIAPPVVTGINPTSGVTTGGTKVVISGTGFTGATSVSFGQTAASSFTVVSDTQITAISPAGSGIVDIIVTTAGGTSATGTPDQFTYTSVSIS